MNRIKAIVAFVLLLSTSLSAGVVGGPQSRHGLLSPGEDQVFKFQFEHFQEARIKVAFDIYGADKWVCDNLKVKVWVGKDFFFAGSGRYEMSSETAYCIAEGGYGSAHNYAKDRRDVTVQVLNTLSSGAFTFDLTTN